MKKSLLLLTFFAIICGAKTNAAITEIAHENKIETAINHSKWNELLQKHVSSKGNVDYKGFKKDALALQSYLDLLAKNTPEKSWSKNAVLAYWINAYNAFTVKLILDNYPIKSIKKINGPWDKEFFALGGKKYSLGEIEHKILRKMNEPRIHFAINCASFSCPNLANEAYTEAELEKQLSRAAKSFLNDASKNAISANKAELSQIFDWFSDDFKKNGTLIDFINKYSLVKMDDNAKISFKDYNWNLNE
ncbi:DUF547 domain-containing protein [Flavobacterium soyangense]|uniref:DUF547 domain-containing protein n=1 Tax=Flavobacterium soyangense TaxID=2023265 RepID=A0A930UCM3_9FLAO|nr:DUF547 domain-containing protein [Flavobacterium soyangense]MBF2709610.1 DUF547 domain-containing protein [Flavobacterium soyangense]